MNSEEIRKYIENINDKIKNYDDAEKAFIYGVAVGVALGKDARKHNKAS